MTTVALLSDVHMRDEHAAAVGAELDAVIDELEAAAPARAFVLGDLIEDGASPERDAANVRAVRDRLSAAEFPVTYLLGNHDVENLDRATLSDLLGQGSFRRVERVDGTPFVCLDSTRDGGCGARGALGAEQVAWLRETLPGLADPIVLTHHPVGDFDLSGNDWFRQFPERAFLGDRKELLDVLREAGTARGTISGHIHDTRRTRFFGLPHVSVGAFSKETPDTPVTGAFATVEIGTGDDPGVGIEVRTRESVRGSFSLG